MPNFRTRIVQGIVPPDGWTYPQVLKLSDGTEIIATIRANTCQELIQAIIDWRNENSVPVGSPVADLEAYMCQRAPHMCHGVLGAHVSVSVQVPSGDHTTPLQSFVDRIVAWLESQINDLGMHALVMPTEANRRADICMRCPMNVAWQTSCNRCTDNVNRLVSIIRHGQNLLLKDRRLKACRVLHYDLRAAVFLKDERVASLNPKLPQACWCRKADQ